MTFQVGMKNSDYLSIFCHVLLPVAYEVSHFGTFAFCSQILLMCWRLFIFDSLPQFCPDLVLVCAGFDSAIGDPEVLNRNHHHKACNAIAALLQIFVCNLFLCACVLPYSLHLYSLLKISATTPP